MDGVQRTFWLHPLPSVVLLQSIWRFGAVPAGGSDSAERVVTDHLGTDWAATSGNRDVRMKVDRIKTTATTEEVSLPPGENEHWSQQWRRHTSSAEEKTELTGKKFLQTDGEGGKSKKTRFVAMKPYRKSHLKKQIEDLYDK